MEVKITYTSDFLRQLKRLRKKYHSMREDFAVLLQSLEANPFQGSDLGNGVRKIRMTITSKGKGKSGGARIITYNVILSIDSVNVTLLTIYDKNEISNVSDAYIRSLISDI